MRAIDADALIADIKECIEAKDSNYEWEQVEGLEVSLSCVDDAPTIEPERKKGKWIDTGSGQECSECHEIQYGYDSFRYFCTFCGEDMRGE